MIIYTEPNSSVRECGTEALSDAGFDVRDCGSLADARDALEGDGSVDCLVTEYELPDGTGLELAREVRETAPDAVCILFTDVPLTEVDTAEFETVVAEYLSKDPPDAWDELVALVDHSIRIRSQTAYPLPADEDARLDAVDRYASDSEELRAALDRLTEIATGLFDVESAAIGFIDTHQERFFSCYGGSFGPMDREDTICTYAILDDDVTVVEDVAADPRFSENEELADADIRFYAGTPLLTPDSRAIGTFCVFDDEPRPFSERDRELLGLLAEEAMDQLSLRYRLRDDGGEDR